MTPTVLRYGAPILREKAHEYNLNFDAWAPGYVTSIHERLLTDALLATPGLGVAAPQIGLGFRAFSFYTDTQAIGEIKEITVAFNPTVVESSGEYTDKEGCLSMPGLWFDVTRPAASLMEYRDAQGERHVIEAGPLLTRLFFHEIDHLDGKLLVDYVSRQQRRAAMRAFNVEVDARP
jgi:peptide deformylase